MGRERKRERERKEMGSKKKRVRERERKRERYCEIGGGDRKGGSKFEQVWLISDF